MARRTLAVLLAVGLTLTVGSPALPCSICGGNYKQKPTLREEAASTSARLVLYGSLRNPRINPDGGGVTELQIAEVLKPDAILGERKSIELPRYVPVSDAKDPPRFLVFCDVYDKGKLDPYRGTPLKGAESLDYARKAMARDPRARVENLVFYFNYLENPDKEVAADAFLEFAKATDQEIAQAAAKLSPEKLRGWVNDAKNVTGDRLALYATLLGACGGPADADLLKKLLTDPTDREREAYHGLLSGYIHLKPAEGWDLALALLADGRKPISTRLAAVRTLRYYQGAQPEKSRPLVLKGLAALIAQGELADVAVDDLIRYQWWDLTPQVLGVYGKKGYDAPLMQRAIIRYALVCKPTDEIKRFLAERRRAEPDVVQEVEELLQFEKKK
jgi:hypothetical protein